MGVNFFGLNLVYCGLLLGLGLALVFFKFDYTVYAKKTAEAENSNSDRLIPILPLILLLLAVLGRGFGGSLLKPIALSSPALMLAFASAIAIGKLVGGFVSDKIGGTKAVLFLLVPSAFLLGDGGTLIAPLLLGILLFNTTMPITLFLATKALSQYKNFAFGLCAFLLMVGTFLAQLVYSKIGFNTYAFIAATLLCAAMIIYADKSLAKRRFL